MSKVREYWKQNGDEKKNKMEKGQEVKAVEAFDAREWWGRKQESCVWHDWATIK